LLQTGYQTVGILAAVLIAFVAIRYFIWPTFRGDVKEGLPTRSDVRSFAERGGPTDDWEPSLLIWLCILGAIAVLGGLFYYNCQTTLGENWTPWVQDRTPYLLLIGIVICFGAARALWPRTHEN